MFADKKPKCNSQQMKYRNMKRTSPFIRNHIESMPLYNRSHGQSKLSNDGDIALVPHKKQQVYLEREIKSEDTLQAVALEFNVSVAELKRINNIHKENEIYARKVLKVPSNPLSLLLEKEYFFENESSSPEETPKIAEDESSIIIDTVNNSNCNPRNFDETSQDEEQPSKFSYVAIKPEDTQESATLLTTSPISPETNDVISCSGADWGISWHVLICVTLVLGVGGPILFVCWFLWGKSEKTEGS